MWWSRNVSMDENGISEQFRENVIDDAVVAGTFMGDKPVEGIAPGGEPGSKFPEFDIAPLGVNDIVAGVDGVEYLPKPVAGGVLERLDARVIIEADRQPPPGHGGKPAEPFG